LENGEFMSNRNLKLAVFSAIAASCLGLAHQAAAAVVYSYVTDKSSYTGAPGSSVVVDVYLKEDLTNGSTSFLASDNGLAAFAVLINKSNAPAAPATITGSNVNGTDFPLFHANTMVVAGGASASIGGAIDVAATAGVLPGNTGGGAVTGPAVSNEIFLGTLNVTVGSSGATTFTVGALDPVNGTNTVTKANVFDLDTGLDGDLNPTTAYTAVGTTLTSFTVSAPIPEPASMGLLAVGGLLALRRRRA
jgi:PEP-CTERM motif